MRFAKLVRRADKLSLRLRLRPLRRGRRYFSDESCVDVSMRWRCHQHRLADMNALCGLVIAVDARTSDGCGEPAGGSAIGVGGVLPRRTRQSAIQGERKTNSLLRQIRIIGMMGLS
jgi:hypothetical protein